MSWLDWNTIENSKHGITDCKYVPSENNPLQSNKFIVSFLNNLSSRKKPKFKINHKYEKKNPKNLKSMWL